ncbi:MAG: phosphatidylserine synthase [marine bacterium B5-7]|nr:MAG: phosphatidylserine synthase [marine bacterium B5-7]
MTDNGTDRPRKGIYVLPSLVTTASLFVGFFAIVQATLGRFEMAAIAIYISMVLDGFDGRIARWTNTASDFGKEYDSLVDVVSFGLTPALVMFEWSLSTYGKLGWLTAFLYVACTALRLARFNSVDVKDKRYFQGIPCPAAAAFVAGWVWVMVDYDVGGRDIGILSIIIMVGAALAMVSNLPYKSFKDFDPKNRVPFVALLLVLFPFVLIAFDPPRVLFLGFLVYLLSGPLLWARRRRVKARLKSIMPDKNSTDKDSSTAMSGGESLEPSPGTTEGTKKDPANDTASSANDNTDHR